MNSGQFTGSAIQILMGYYPPMPKQQPDIFIGRLTELQELESLLSNAATGRGRIVTISGEPGIGKSYIAKQVSDRCLVLGGVSPWGRVSEEDGAPAYGIWVQILDQLFRELDENHLRNVVQDHASSLSVLLPRYSSVFAVSEPTRQADDPNRDKLQLFHAVRSVLLAISTHQLVTLVLDDIHWADQESLELLEFLADGISKSQLLVVCTYRDIQLPRSHPLSKSLSGIARRTDLQRIYLQRFSLQETGQLVTALASRHEDALEQQIHSSTEGNPLFIAEVVRLLEASGGVGEIPEGIKEAIGRRINSLTEIASDVLEFAAIVGRRFGSDLLIDLLVNVYSREQIFNCIDEALGARLIAEEHDTNLQFRFAHGLIREVLLSEIPFSRKVELHAAALKAKENRFAGSLDEHSAELLEHAVFSRSLIGSKPVVSYALMATEYSVRSKAPQNAFEHLDVVNEFTDDESLDDALANWMTEIAYVLNWWVPPGSPFRPSISKMIYAAFDYFTKRNKSAEALAVAMRAWGSFGELNIYPLLLQAITLCDPGSSERAWLECRAAFAVGAERGGQDAADAHFNEALSLVERNETSIETSASVFAMGALHHFRFDNYEKTRELSARVLGYRHELKDPLPMAHVAEATMYLHFFDGQIDEAIKLAEHIIHTGRERSETARSISGFLAKGAFYVAGGELDRAVQEMSSALEVIPFSITMQAMLSSIHTYRGDRQLANQAITATEELDEFIYGESGLSAAQVMQRRTATNSAAIALLEGGSDRFARQMEKVRRVHMHTKEDHYGMRDYFMTQQLCLAIEAVVNGDPVNCESWYQKFEPSRREHFFFGSIDIESFISRPRLMAKLAATAGRIEEVGPWYELAIENSSKKNLNLDLAFACFELAEFKIAHSSSPGIHGVEELLTRSSGLATTFGIVPLVEKVDSVRSGLSSDGQNPDRLTARELEVLFEIAAGKSNKEVAESLVITPNTVATHVKNVFAKTGSSNRSQATAYAERLRQSLSSDSNSRRAAK